jgi:hypothetical protein
MIAELLMVAAGAATIGAGLLVLDALDRRRLAPEEPIEEPDGEPIEEPEALENWVGAEEDWSPLAVVASVEDFVTAPGSIPEQMCRRDPDLERLERERQQDQWWAETLAELKGHAHVDWSYRLDRDVDRAVRSRHGDELADEIAVADRERWARAMEETAEQLRVRGTYEDILAEWTAEVMATVG